MGQQLNPKNLIAAFPGESLSVVLYWKQRSGIDSFQNGHSALVIDAFKAFTHLGDTNYYVSWLGQAKGSNPFSRRALSASLDDDMRQWGGSPPGSNIQMPTRWVALRTLNIEAMKLEWDRIRTKESAHWKIVDKNCATTVARVLKAGGADQYATRAKNQLVWWPTDLITYARSMGPQAIATTSSAI